jgi:integrase
MLASYQQTLKETGARPGEIWKSEWDDLDIAGKRFTISHPEKGCNPRIINISDRLIQMLLSLPRPQKRIFPYKSRGFIGKLFRQTHQRAIKKFGNSELRKIKPYTYRYWRATFEYHKTHDFGAVMVLLGHNSLKYVLLYAQLSESYFGDRSYLYKEAFTRQEAMQLIEQGFEFVLTDKEGISLFRKLK